MTKEKIEYLLERFEGLSLGAKDGDGVRGRDSARTDTLFTLVILLPSIRSSAQFKIPSSAPERIEAKFRGPFDRDENVGNVEGNEETKTVSELMDYTRDAVTNYQVSGGARVVSVI